MSSTKKCLNEEFSAPHPISSPFLSIADHTKNYYLSELLPYELHGKFGDRLFQAIKEYDFLLTSTELAMQAVEKGHLSCFDPLVGENACQIRALKNCLIFSQFPINSHDLLTKIHIIKQKIKNLSLDHAQVRDEKKTLKFLLTSENLEINLTYSEIYLIKSFLLTLVKTIKPPKADFPFIKNEYTDFKKLKDISPISTIFAESLIKKLRESLSAFSVSFIRELSINCASNHFISSHLACVQYKRLHCLPCYWVTKALLVKCIESAIPLVLVVRQMATDQNYAIGGETTLFFSGGKYVDEAHLNPHAASLILLVNACRPNREFPQIGIWKDELQQKNPIDLILAYAASHRQYPGDNDHGIHQINDPEFSFYKKKAMEWGCSILNPSLFFLSHALCDRIENVSKYFSPAHDVMSF